MAWFLTQTKSCNCVVCHGIHTGSLQTLGGPIFFIIGVLVLVICATVSAQAGFRNAIVNPVIYFTVWYIYHTEGIQERIEIERWFYKIIFVYSCGVCCGLIVIDLFNLYSWQNSTLPQRKPQSHLTQLTYRQQDGKVKRKTANVCL